MFSISACKPGSDQLGMSPAANPDAWFRLPALVLCCAIVLALSMAAGGISNLGGQGTAAMFLYGAIGISSLAAFVLWPCSSKPANRRVSVWIVLLTALCCRAAFLPLPASDDVNRYVWEGTVLLEDHNPYTLAPDAPELLRLRDDSIWPGINHKDQAACYPPLTIRLFAGVAALKPHPGVFKLLFGFADFAGVLLLLALLRRRGLDERWIALYALNPLLLFSFAGQGHLDALQVMFLLAALLAFDSRRWGWMFAAAGLAVQSKYVAVLALPFLVNRTNWRWSWIWLATVALPFFDLAFGHPLAMFASLREFASHMAFGGSVHSLLRAALGGDIEPATAICAGLFAVSALVLLVLAWRPVRREAQSSGEVQEGPPTRTEEDALPFLLGIFAALLLFSPTVHFWYISWVLPLAVLRRRGSWILLSLTAGLSFSAIGLQHQTGRWALSALVLGLMWGPFWLLFLREMWFALNQRKVCRPFPLCQLVSVVIPARNEEGCIGETVRAAAGGNGVCEVFVVDGGSEDQTRQEAAAAGARVLLHNAALDKGGGRGGQIRAGVRAAGGDAVVVLHADTHPPADFAETIMQTLNRNPDVVGGSFGGRFDGRGAWLRLLELANDCRALLLGLAFGDQIQFFRRRPALQADAVPDIPLMEDVELSLRLRRIGRTVFLGVPGLVSPRRWQSKRGERSATVIKLTLSYCIQRIFRSPDTVAMYRRYYR